MRARRIFLALLILFVAGCAGAYVKVMQRGDDLARQGHWDLAAAEYERALALDPGNPEVGQRLQGARRNQAADRVRRAHALLQQGDAPAALALAQEAAWLDPSSLEARYALAHAVARALDLAEQRVAAGEPRRALDLTTQVLRATPADPRALRLDASVREQLAAEAYARADAFAQQGKLGNALLEMAAAGLYVPGYRDAAARMGQIKRALREQITFTAIVSAFSSDATARDLSPGVGAERLRQAIDPALPLEVVAGGTGEGTPGAQAVGVRIGGSFEGYAYRHDEGAAPRSCMFVCGVSTVANPEHGAAEAALEDARAELGAADAELGRARAELPRWEREVEDVRRAIERAQLDADRARLELDKCRAKPNAGASACSAEEAAVERTTARLRAEQARLAGPEGSLGTARARVAAAESRQQAARGAVEAAAARLHRTPRTMEVARRCSHAYLASVHAVRAAVTVTVSAASVSDGAVLFDREGRLYEERGQDETFPPQPGRCDEVAGGDPLELPSELELKHALITKAVAGVRDKILFAYDRYRQQYLASAQREQAAGASDEAVERYARYLLLGRADNEERARILGYLAAAKGITPAAAHHAL
jgi:tetratricopeptide (TPR) repeat protein